MKCEDCRFWLDIKKTCYGECRKDSPVISGLMPHIIEDYKNDPIKRKMRGRWPITLFEDWCGEFQPKETEDTCNHAWTPDGKCLICGKDLKG